MSPSVYPFCPYPAPPAPAKVPLVVLPEHPCVYLSGRTARIRAFATDSLPAELYHDFMDAGFRRSGVVFYQPICRGCRACMPIRVPVRQFEPGKSQRRCRRRNSDITVSMGKPAATDEKFDLYRNYVADRHCSKDEDRGAFESFLCQSPVQTIEIVHRDATGKLLAVGICDVCTRSLSSVYFYFDPAQSRRGLGTFGALVEIELARRSDIPYYYLGYWVKGCRSMEYKSAFQPCEILGPDGTWRLCVSSEE